MRPLEAANHKPVTFGQPQWSRPLQSLRWLHLRGQVQLRNISEAIMSTPRHGSRKKSAFSFRYSHYYP